MVTPQLSRQAGVSKSTRRQYPQQRSVDENAELMDRPLPAAGSQTQINYVPAHGTPYYTAPGFGSSQGYNHEYKQVDQQSYSITQPASFASMQTDYNYQPKSTLAQRHPKIIKGLRSLAIILFVSLVLAIPIIVTRDAEGSLDGDNATRRKRNTVFWVFVFLITVWLLTAAAYVAALILPFAYRLVCHFVNPAYKRYWRILIMMRKPIVALSAAVAGFISLAIWFWNNDQISEFNNAEGETDADVEAAQQAIAQDISTILVVLTYCIFWASAYFLEKIFIIYLTLHYHYRSHKHEIDKSKTLVDALVGLYNYSYTIYPRGHSAFAAEDWVIHRSLDSKTGTHESKSTAISAGDQMTGLFAQAFGVIFGTEASGHWFAPRSQYALISRALQHPAASAALAKRLWMSLVPEGSDVLTAEDIAEALGPQQAAEAVQYFETLDVNENGDIKLSEMIAMLVDAGQKRQDIYAGMADITHVVNTLDWTLLGIIAFVMVALILLSQVSLLMQLKEVIGFTAIGASFVVGRTFNEIVQGAIFTILDHPYDVGDVCELWNVSETVRVVLTVKRISLLYTVFEEVGSGKATQYANMRSKIKRIANLSRSGKNQESITFSVDHSTTFRDIELFKSEMQKFITAPENSRDYDPTLNVRVAGIGDLNKLDIRVIFKHKSNFSNDGLRSARSSRMHCAIMSVARRVPLSRPGGPSDPVGAEGRPQYTVMVSEAEATEKRATDKTNKTQKRMDYVKTVPAEEDQEAAAKRIEAEETAARDAEAEAEATLRIMGTKFDDVGQRYTGTSSSLDQKQFFFVSGQEKGMRLTRRVR